MSLKSAVEGLRRIRNISLSQTHYFLEGDDLSSLACHDRESLRHKVPLWIESGAVVVLGRFKTKHKAKANVHYLTTLKKNMMQWFDRVARTRNGR
jgi:hypothetical protein